MGRVFSVLTPGRALIGLTLMLQHLLQVGWLVCPMKALCCSVAATNVAACKRSLSDEIGMCEIMTSP